MDYRTDSPQLLLDFLSYHETIKAHSQRTVDEYYLDMRNFFRYLKQQRDPALAGKALDEIDIRDVDIDFISRITLTDIYSYLTYLSRDRVQHQNSEISNKGLNAASRARKLATIRSFFNYICNKRHLLEDNPCKDVDTPKQMKSLPRYLTLDESLSLLDSVDGANRGCWAKAIRSVWSISIRPARMRLRGIWRYAGPLPGGIKTHCFSPGRIGASVVPWSMHW